MVLRKTPIDRSTIVIPQKKIAESITEEVSKKAPATPVGPDAMTPTDGAGLSGASLARQDLPFPENLPQKLGIVLSQDGMAFAVMRDANNQYALPVGCKHLNNIIRKIAREEGRKSRKSEINEINEHLQAHAEMAGKIRDVWYRVAPLANGIVIDSGDDQHTHAKITPGNVEFINSGSDVLFFRTRASRPFGKLAEKGDFNILKKHLNLRPVDATLLIAWITYTLAHPKVKTSNYVILVLQGDQGSGKTTQCHVIQTLIDPSIIGVQSFPSNEKDLAIGAQASHVLFFDNLRHIKPHMADALSKTTTGAYLTMRQLYTDAGQSILRLHVALVVDGIHSFIDQPDLAQRCLSLRLQPIDTNRRKSEADFIGEFQSDLPVIFRGLLDLIASILIHLPSVKPDNPERMIEFSHWLAAMEKALDVPAGIYQSAYSSVLRRSQMDSLLDNPLAAAVFEFSQKQVDGEWSGTPAELLNQLTMLVPTGTQRSRYWPQNPTALSKRLAPLQAGLLSQGISVERDRGKHRRITITLLEGYDND